MDSPVNQHFVELVCSREWDILRMKPKDKNACRKYIIDEIYKYLRNNGFPVYNLLNVWLDLRFDKVRIGTRSDKVSLVRVQWHSPWFQIDPETIGEVMVLLYFWSYNERNKRRVKLIGNFHELCQGGKIRKVIPMDLLRYIMEFY
jgi:hypothetical protein